MTINDSEQVKIDRHVCPESLGDRAKFVTAIGQQAIIQHRDPVMSVSIGKEQELYNGYKGLKQYKF